LSHIVQYRDCKSYPKRFQSNIEKIENVAISDALPLEVTPSAGWGIFTASFLELSAPNYAMFSDDQACRGYEILHPYLYAHIFRGYLAVGLCRQVVIKRVLMEKN